MFGLFKKKPPVVPVNDAFKQLAADFLLKGDAELALRCLEDDPFYIQWAEKQIVDVPWHVEDYQPTELQRARDIFISFASLSSKSLLVFDWKSDFEFDMLPEINQCLDQLDCQKLTQSEITKLDAFYSQDKAGSAFVESSTEMDSILSERGLEFHQVNTNSDSFAFFVCLKGRGAKYNGLEFREFQPFEF